MAEIKINYIELKARDISATKRFYNEVFGWRFTDYGPEYVSFEGAGIDGGFEFTEDEIVNGVLVVLYHKDLEGLQDVIVKAGGKISMEIFSFPGGRRFHFLDPNGNDLAVWSE